MARRPILIIVAVAWVVLTLACIVRSAFVAAYAETDLKRAEHLWADHPSVLAGRAMMDVAGAAAVGRGLAPDTRSLIGDIAREEPLSPAPFLIAGADAQRSSNPGQAERLLVLARQRDPRAPAPRILLAELYISQGRIRDGVPEAAVLGRLLPGSAEPLSQAFARYIQAAGIPDGMADLMRSNPDLSTRILIDLSNDPSNADLLLKLAALAPPRPSGPAPGWQTQLINALVAAGDYGKARTVWAAFAGSAADASAIIQDARFNGSFAPPPFNWTFATQGAVIEPQAGRLHILYFGRHDAKLAGQLLMLAPGPYRLRMTMSGQVAEPQILRWKITCLPGQTAILDQPLDQPAAMEWTLEVPSHGCSAQQLQLEAKASDTGQSSDFVISNLSLVAKGKR